MSYRTFTPLSKMLSKNEYNNLRGLWFKNRKAPEALPICIKCNSFWGNILIALEPCTEYVNLSKEERDRSYEVTENWNDDIDI